MGSDALAIEQPGQFHELATSRPGASGLPVLGESSASASHTQEIPVDTPHRRENKD